MSVSSLWGDTHGHPGCHGCQSCWASLLEDVRDHCKRCRRATTHERHEDAHGRLWWRCVECAATKHLLSASAESLS